MTPMSQIDLNASTCTLELASETDTGRAARALAACLRPGDVLALDGPLGAGKTAFARAAIRHLVGSQEDVPSPTFTLVQTYDAPAFTIWHFDLYRISDCEELLELGWDEAADGVALVEWPDRLGPHAPAHALHLRLAPVADGPTARRLTLTGPARIWGERLAALTAP